VVGVDALATSCPLCEFNLGKQQAELISNRKISKQIPTFYFTQLMAIAFGLAPETCLFELNDPASIDLLTEKKCIGAM
jgi:heterodisulfide reductase subunit B